MDRDRAIAEAVLKAAREAFDDASMSGLCADGAWEVAVGAVRRDLASILAGAGPAPGDCRADRSAAPESEDLQDASARERTEGAGFRGPSGDGAKEKLDSAEAAPVDGEADAPDEPGGG